MSNSKVISSIVKTDNFFKTNDGKDMYQYDLVFESDSKTYSAYSPSPTYLEKFQPGTTVQVTPNPSAKMPNKIKVEQSDGAPAAAPASKSGYSPRKTVDTGRAIMLQTCLKASTDFFKDRQANSLEDVADGAEYLLSRLESHLQADAPKAQEKPAIPTNFLDKLPN